VQDVFNSALKNLVPDLERFIEKFPDILGDIITEIVTEATRGITKTLKRQAKKRLREKYADMFLFETRLYKEWGKALDLLEMLLILTLEAGEDFNSEFRQSAAKTNNYTFEVLTRLHARACQITSEILSLLKTGHADGAHARWRTLHEISVVSSFIAKHGDDLAEAYLLHEGIETYKAARQYQTHCKTLGYEPLTRKEFAEIEATYKKLIERFGNKYEDQYGWASLVIKNKPTFAEIEKTVGLNHLRPYYRMASHNVHANPRGVFFRLGLYPEISDILLAGPSDAGLYDPGT
jgi:NTP pyrophosphatase (non-canonical NTP hydrolase)